MVSVPKKMSLPLPCPLISLTPSFPVTLSSTPTQPFILLVIPSNCSSSMTLTLGLPLSDHYLLYVQLFSSGILILAVLWFHETYKPLTIPPFHWFSSPSGPCLPPCKASLLWVVFIIILAHINSLTLLLFCPPHWMKAWPWSHLALRYSAPASAQLTRLESTHLHRAGVL